MSHERSEVESLVDPRWLEARRSLDQRSRHPRVWEEFLRRLAACSGAKETATPRDGVRVLELGSGTGAMLTRLAGASSLSGSSLHVTALEREPHFVERLRETARAVTAGPPEGPGLEVEIVAGDLFDVDLGDASFDACIACAVLDMVDTTSALERAQRWVRAGGLLYAPLHFDGVTALEPAVDEALDPAIEDAFHASMEAAPPSLGDGSSTTRGGARTGRRLLVWLAQHGFEVLDAGASDWIVHPRRDADGRSGYSEDETYLLRRLVEGMAEHAVEAGVAIRERIDSWREARFDQIERAELVYVAHQLDVLARRL